MTITDKKTRDSPPGQPVFEFSCNKSVSKVHWQISPARLAHKKNMNILALSLTNENGPTIRGTKTPDGEERWSVYDFINAVCSKDPKSQYGHHVYYELIKDESEYKIEVCQLSSNFKFPGRGQRDTPTMTVGYAACLLERKRELEKSRRLERTRRLRSLSI